jgi:predicted PurR-regulated permease PerM
VLASLVLVVASLYWTRAVLLPLVLDILLTFLLGPVVRVLRRRGFKRTTAVLLVVFLAVSFLGVTGWIVGVEVSNLVREFPRHPSNLHQRLAGQGGLAGAVSGHVLRC